MKRILTLLIVALLTFSFTSCHENMRRDVKRLAHKTEQCFSKADLNSIDNSENKEFNQCYSKLEKLMNKLDKKYASEEESLEFGRLYLEELQQSSLPDDFKELCAYLYIALKDGQPSIPGVKDADRPWSFGQLAHLSASLMI